MPNIIAAEIIPFLTHATRPMPGTHRSLTPKQTPAADPNRRLARALAALDESLAGQRAAMAAWTASLTDLHAAASRLGASLGRYDERLTTLSTSVARLHRDTAHLGYWADGVLSREA